MLTHDWGELYHVTKKNTCATIAPRLLLSISLFKGVPMFTTIWTRKIQVCTIDFTSHFDAKLHGAKCSLDPKTRDLMRTPHFSRYGTPRTIEAVCVALTEDSHHDGIVYEAKELLNLVPGKSELAPQLAIQYTNQPDGELLHLITEPTTKPFLTLDSDPSPKKFCLRTYNRLRDLRIVNTSWDTVYKRGTKLVLTQAG